MPEPLSPSKPTPLQSRAPRTQIGKAKTTAPAGPTKLWAALLYISLTFLSLGFFSPTISFGAPKNPADYDIEKGGMADIADGAYIEGSSRYGGLQPDYIIDLNAEPLQTVIKKASAIGRMELPFWAKIDAVSRLVGQESFKNKAYHDPSYRLLMQRYREEDRDVPLSQYVACQSGVCREHALVLHFALKAAGIPNRHIYALAFQGGNLGVKRVAEDHAFVAVNYGGEDWAIDAYNQLFHGFPLKDLLSENGIDYFARRAPFARPERLQRGLVRINSFPMIYNPKQRARSCSELLH